MKKYEHLSSAKAIIGILSLGIIFVIYIKFQENQLYFFEDPNALRNYVTIAIVAGGLLITLLYLASHTTHHKIAKSTKSTKVSKRKK